MGMESDIHIFYVRVNLDRDYLLDETLKFKLVDVVKRQTEFFYELYAYNVFDDEFSLLYGIGEKEEARVRKDIRRILRSFFMGGVYPYRETADEVERAADEAVVRQVSMADLVDLICYIDLYARNNGYARSSGTDWWWSSSSAYLTLDRERRWKFVKRDVAFRLLGGSVSTAVHEMRKRHRNREMMGNPMPFCILVDDEAA